MSSFLKSGHIYPRFQDFMAALMRFLRVVDVGISSCYVLDLIVTVSSFYVVYCVSVVDASLKMFKYVASKFW